MATVYGVLAKEAIKIFDKFTPGKHQVDDFLKEASKDLKKMGTQQQKFVLDVISGCIEHKNVVDLVIDDFYGQNGKIPESHRSQFVIVCYLATFALDDIGLRRFDIIVKALDFKNMHAFLSFFATNLTTCIQEKWNSVSDAAHVEEKLIGPLLRWQPEIHEIVDQLAKQLPKGHQVKKVPKKTTEPQEVPLTHPKPTPKSTYKAPKEFETLQRIKQQNRQKKEELLHQANIRQVRCAIPIVSERKKKVESQIKEELNERLKIKSFYQDPPPSDERDSNTFKLTKADTLRKGANEVRQDEWELQRIKHLLEGKGDCDEERITTKEPVRDQKSPLLQLKETAQLMQKYAKKRLQQEKAMRDLVRQVAKGHKNSKEAEEKLKKLKQSIVQEVTKKHQGRLRKALEEAQAELILKLRIIQEIGSFNSHLDAKFKALDDTETAGQDVLEEMSLAELRKRLVRLKDLQKREEEEKRERLRQKLLKEKQQEQERLKKVNLQRNMAKVAAVRKAEDKARVEKRQQQRREMEQLQKEKQEQRQEERMKKKALNTQKKKIAKTTPTR